MRKLFFLILVPCIVLADACDELYERYSLVKKIFYHGLTLEDLLNDRDFQGARERQFNETYEFDEVTGYTLLHFLACPDALRQKGFLNKETHVVNGRKYTIATVVEKSYLELLPLSSYSDECGRLLEILRYVVDSRANLWEENSEGERPHRSFESSSFFKRLENRREVLDLLTPPLIDF